MPPPTTARHPGRAKPPTDGLYRPFPCRIESVQDLTEVEKLFRLKRLDGQPFGHRPGQFVQVSLPGLGEAPISVSSSPTRGDFLDLGVRRAGRVTGALHELAAGDDVGLRGPFGTCFDTDAMAGKDLLLISGGCGLAPLRALIQYVEDRADRFGQVTVLYGARTPADRLYKEDLARWRASPRLACEVTVDAVPGPAGWDGHVGVVTTLLGPIEIDPARTTAVVVGPPVMYRFVIKELLDKGLAPDHIIVSLERYMKCGVGKCGHCAIEHLYCCLDGPVFSYAGLQDVRGAL